MSPIRVAALQAAPISFNLTSSIGKLRELVAQAALEGASLAVLPEAFLSCYPRHLGFKIGSRVDEDREWFGKYVESSVRVPDQVEGTAWLDTCEELGPMDEYWAFQGIARIAKESKIHLSIGVIERSLVGATLWCTNLLFSPQGVLLSKHRKLQPTAAERIVWSQGHARNESPLLSSGGASTDNLAVVDTPIGKIGGLICWENLMPLARYALYKKGVEIYTAPTADGRLTWLPSMQHIAQEGRCFVISANQFHKPSDFPSDYPPSAERSSKGLDGEDEAWSRGGSCIVDPLGNVLAGPLWDVEGIIYADIDLAKLNGYKLDFDVCGHYGREDVFSYGVKA
ncbi:nitrilase, partial [Phenoliferia sp. Uapishka_3]